MKTLDYLKRVVWPAVYITILNMGIWLLFVGCLHVFLISRGDESIISMVLPIQILLVVGGVIIFALCFVGGHTIYRHSNGEDWIKFAYLLRTPCK